MSAPASRSSGPRIIVASAERRQILRRWRKAKQSVMFCSCGEGTPVTRAGLCRPCQRKEWQERRASTAQPHSCELCGKEKASLRRVKGDRDAAVPFPSLCKGCHMRIRRLRAIRHWLPARVAQLWQELHPGLPVQLQLWGTDPSSDVYCPSTTL